MSGTAFSASQQELLEEMEKQRATMRGAGGTTWHRLNTGANRVRFITDGTVLPIVGFKQHRGKKDDGKFTTLVDLDFAVRDQRLFEASELSEEDVDLIGRFGDPVNQLRKALPDSSKEWPQAVQDANPAPFSGDAGMAVAIINGEVGLLRLPKTVFERINEIASLHPLYAFAEEGNDLQIVRQGEGIKTKYSADPFPNGPHPIDVGDEELPDPYRALARDVASYKNKVEFAVRSYPVHVDFAREQGFEFGGV